MVLYLCTIVYLFCFAVPSFPNSLTVVATPQNSYVADLCAKVPPQQVFVQIGNICRGHTPIFLPSRIILKIIQSQ